MFELSNQKAKLLSVRALGEQDTDNPKAELEMKWSCVVPNVLLAEFHPQLRDLLYKKPEDTQQPDMVDPDMPSELRFPDMSGFKWGKEYVGHTLVVPYGTGGKSDITLEEVKVDKFRLRPIQGGSTEIGFRTVGAPAEKDVGKLCSFVRREIDINLIAPPPQTVQQLFNEPDAA